MSVPLLVLLLGSASALGCPGSDWAEAGASCYHRSSRSLSWREGNDYCQQQGGYMVEVKICNGFRIRRQGQIGLERSASWSLLRIHGPREWRDRPTDRGRDGTGDGMGKETGRKTGQGTGQRTSWHHQVGLMRLLMIQKACMHVYKWSRFFFQAEGRTVGSTRGSTRGPRGPKKAWWNVD